MDRYITGGMIKALREDCGMTQAELAGRLNVSDKAVSKWETGKGYPDITLLEPIAKVFEISVAELISGTAVRNLNVSANMMRSKFYVCPVCGNVIHSTGELAVSCHGITLLPQEAEASDGQHTASVSIVEDEYFVSIDHEMTKNHYISFIAAMSSDRLQMIKLYPEGPAECRIKRGGVSRVYYYCNRDGLFCLDIKRNFVRQTGRRDTSD